MVTNRQSDINIKPQNRGKFTAEAEKKGLTVTQFAK